MNVVATLLLRTEANGGPHADDGGLILVLLALLNSGVDTGVVAMLSDSGSYKDKSRTSHRCQCGEPPNRKT